MKKFLANFLNNRKLLIVIASMFFALGAGTLLASACGYRTCGCSYTDEAGNTADDYGTCAGTVCWFSSPSVKCAGHAFSGEGVSGASNATCTSGGYVTKTIVCNICHRPFSWNEDVPALGHDMGNHWDDKGTYHYESCNRCGHSHEETHRYGSWVAHTGYRRKDCESSMTGCGQHSCYINDSNGCDAYREEWHYTTIYLNTNGGFWINGGGNEERNGKPLRRSKLDDRKVFFLFTPRLLRRYE